MEAGLAPMPVPRPSFAKCAFVEIASYGPVGWLAAADG